MERITLHIESDQNVEEMIKKINDGFKIVSGPTQITGDLGVVKGEHKGYGFGLYRLEKK